MAFLWSWGILRRWGPVWIAWIVCLAFLAWVAVFQGMRPLGFGLSVGIIQAILIYAAVNVYYIYIIAVDVDEGGRMTALFYDVPMERAGDIDIKGNEGILQDRWGRPLRIVKDFNPDTMRGNGTWPVMTPIEVAAEFRAAKRVMYWAKGVIDQYGVASITAHLEAARQLFKVAHFGSNLVNIPEISAEELMTDELSRTKEPPNESNRR